MSKLNKSPDFIWNEEDGTALCLIKLDGIPLTGKARCSDEDRDMQSETVGCNIALMRAGIKGLKHSKKYECETKLKCLYQLHYSINQSKHFNPRGYCEKMLCRQIQLIEETIRGIDEMLAQQEQSLKEYIAEKEHLYVSIRKNRKANTNQ